MEKQIDSAMKIAAMLNDASIDSVMAIDVEWKVIAWNKTTELITSISKEYAMGRHLIEIFPQIGNDAEMLSAYEFGLKGKKSFLPSKPDLFNRSHYENHFIPLQDEDGHIIGVMNLVHDVAHRIKAEQQLQKLNMELKEKYRELEKAKSELATFTTITGNDLKEPLKKVYTSLEMIMMNDGQKLSDSSKAGLRRMQASLNRVKLLLDDILAISTANSFTGDYSTVRLPDLVNAVQFSLRNKIKENEAVIHIESLPTISGSEQMLRNLFYNLIDNSLKFQRPGNRPSITITGSVAQPRNGEFREKEYTCLSFTDNGIGFDQADSERIFNMFERLHERSEFSGSGIGLTICRKIVEAHGGYMEAEGYPGQGATFRCFLPI